MNKLSKALIHEVAIQGKKKAHWDKVYQVFKVQETRTTWQDWVKYKEIIDHGCGDTVCQIKGYGYGAQVRRVKKGWSIGLDRDVRERGTGRYVDQLTAQLTHPDRPFVLLGFTFSVPRAGRIHGPDWINGLVQMANWMASNGYYFYYLRWDWKQIMHEVIVKTPKDLQDFLDKADPETMYLMVRAILGSGLDFYPEPVLQVLQRAQKVK